MGSWFSNLHIRKNDAITEGKISEYICNIMAAQQYKPVSSPDEADGAFAIVSDDTSAWYSVYSDLFSFEMPKAFSDYAIPMSGTFKTDVLGISCFDSDYLYLNLINTTDKTDGWIGIGSAKGLGLKRTTGLKAWKTKVSSFSEFSAKAKEKYVFAEDFLTAVEQDIALPLINATASYEYLSDYELDAKATYLYYKLPESIKPDHPVQLVPYMSKADPCFMEKPSVVSNINIGSASRGLSVYFLGPYVENDEITFSDVSFVRIKNNQSERNPIELSKIQLEDGQWAYYYHDPGFRIPAKADERLPRSKQFQYDLDNHISLRFITHGNPRKMLDITVVMVPDKNPDGQAGWNVWHGWGSKKAFIDHYNKTQQHWYEIYANIGSDPSLLNPLLKEEDFD